MTNGEVVAIDGTTLRGYYDRVDIYLSILTIIWQTTRGLVLVLLKTSNSMTFTNYPITPEKPG
jgi:hypothetical protein